MRLLQGWTLQLLIGQYLIYEKSAQKKKRRYNGRDKSLPTFIPHYAFRKQPQRPTLKGLELGRQVWLYTDTHNTLTTSEVRQSVSQSVSDQYVSQVRQRGYTSALVLGYDASVHLLQYIGYGFTYKQVRNPLPSLCQLCNKRRRQVKLSKGKLNEIRWGSSYIHGLNLLFT